VKDVARFAGVSLRKDHMRIGFLLARVLPDHARIVQRGALGKTRMGHAVALRTKADVDAELIGWLREAYALKAARGHEARGRELKSRRLYREREARAPSAGGVGFRCTMPAMIEPIPGVADVERLGRGDRVDLLVEVPHGADRAAHYQALRDRLAGALPAGLEEFFFVNTDSGAWQVGRRVAERLVAADPARTALIVRCLIPRTFIDCNRVEDASADAGMTASVPAYVHDAADRALLLDLHRRYVGLVERAHAALDGDGFVLGIGEIN